MLDSHPQFPSALFLRLFFSLDFLPPSPLLCACYAGHTPGIPTCTDLRRGSRMIWQACDVRLTLQLSRIILYCARLESYIRKTFGFFALLKRTVSASLRLASNKQSRIKHLNPASFQTLFRIVFKKECSKIPICNITNLFYICSKGGTLNVFLNLIWNNNAFENSCKRNKKESQGNMLSNKSAFQIFILNKPYWSTIDCARVMLRRYNEIKGWMIRNRALGWLSYHGRS